MNLAEFGPKSIYEEYIQLDEYKKTNNLNNYSIIYTNNKYKLTPPITSACTDSTKLNWLTYEIKNGTVVKSSTNLKTYEGQICHAISPAAKDDWCNRNCNNNPPYCPSTMCSCGGGPGPSPGPPPAPTPAQPTPAPGTPTPPPTPGAPTPGTPTPAPESDYYTGPPYTFPTHRSPYQKVRWLYTCTKGQGNACVVSNLPPDVSDLYTNGINYISLITGLPTGNAEVLNACLPTDQTTFLIPATTTGIQKCGNGCTPGGVPGTTASCYLVKQGWVDLPYDLSQITTAHKSGISVSLVLGSWNVIFPNQYTINNESIKTIKDPAQYAAELYSRFMFLRTKLNNCIDGIDFDWEGFATTLCTWGDGCLGSGWDSNCSGNGFGQKTKGTPGSPPAACFQLADSNTIKYINAIAEIFKANPLGQNHNATDYKGNKLDTSLWSSSPPDFGKPGGLSVTVVPMSSQMFSSISGGFNGQNQYRDLNPKLIDALLLQWYSGFDGGATAKVTKDWVPSWLKESAKSLPDLARGCDTNMETASWLPKKISTSVVADSTHPQPPTDIAGYVAWIAQNYPDNDGNARCLATSQLKDPPGEYSARCPRRLDCPDWWYSDDKFMHQSQLYLLSQFAVLNWDLGTQLIVGLEFFTTAIDTKQNTPHKYGSQWGPIPDVYLVLGLDAALKGPDAYQKYYSQTVSKSDYADTFNNVNIPDKLKQQLSPLGLGGVGGWTLTGALQSSPYMWKEFLSTLCTSNPPGYPICNKPIPNPVISSSGEAYYVSNYKY